MIEHIRNKVKTNYYGVKDMLKEKVRQEIELKSTNKQMDIINKFNLFF